MCIRDRLQPEQAQNGVCVERMGCGQRLQKGIVFTGGTADIEAAFISRPIAAIADAIAAFLADTETPARLDLASRQIGNYHGTETLAMLLENS